jgi:FxsC-like protein
MTLHPLYFFLSYAHSDDRVNVGEFFKDLSAAVRQRAGLPPETVVGFIDDEDVGVGVSWRSSVSDAISACVCFVPLVSPNYFRSEECGREYNAFLMRTAAHAGQRNGQRPDMLLPVQWLPGAKLTPEIAELGVTPNVLGDTYRSMGLGEMLRHYRAHEQEYHEILMNFAEEIIRKSIDYQMLPPTDPIDLRFISSLFHDEKKFGGRSDKPRHVYFVVASDGRPTMMKIRYNAEVYAGDTCGHWRPYHPRLPKPIGEYSYFIAKAGGYDCGLTDITNLDELVRWAEVKRQMIVVIVDTWAARLASHRKNLEQYDKVTAPATAVMVPFSQDDNETRDASAELHSTLQAVFPRRYHEGSLFRRELPTHEEFSTQLLEVLRVAQNDLLRRQRKLQPDNRQPTPPGLANPVGHLPFPEPTARREATE